MAEKDEKKVIRQCQNIIKKCKELDEAMVLSKKERDKLTKEELKKLRKLEKKIRRFCEE